jgi:hypothetical protein
LREDDALAYTVSRVRELGIERRALCFSLGSNGTEGSADSDAICPALDRAVTSVAARGFQDFEHAELACIFRVATVPQEYSAEPFHAGKQPAHQDALRRIVCARNTSHELDIICYG